MWLYPEDEDAASFELCDRLCGKVVYEAAIPPL